MSRIFRAFPLTPLCFALLATALAACSDKGSPDTRPNLAVVSTSPASGATGVGLNAALSVTFNRPVEPSTVSLATITFAPAIAGDFAESGNTVTFTPSAALQPLTLYTVTVTTGLKATGGTGLTQSVTATFTTAAAPDTTAPAAITNLTIASTTATSAVLTWTATGDDGAVGTATSYDLRYASSEACPITASNFVGATKVTTAAPKAAGQAETATVTGLGAKATVCFAIKAADEVPNTSDLSNVVTATLPDGIAPAAPVLTAGAVTGTSINVLWTDVGDDGTTGTVATQELRYSAGATCLTVATFGSGTLVAGTTPHVAGTADHALVSGLASDTAHCFILKVADASGNAVFSNVLAQRTADVTAPATPVLTASNITGAAVTLSWTAVGDDGTTGTATSQQLRYLSGASCPIVAANFSTGTQVTTGAPAVAGTAQTATASGLTSDTAYCFALQVSDEANNSALSASVPARTLDVTAPAAITSLTATAKTKAQDATGKTVTIAFTASGDDGAVGTAASYDLRYQTVTAGSPCTLAATFGGTQITTGVPAPKAAGGAESFDVTMPASDATYCYRVKVIDEAGNSALSNVATATTPDVTAPAAVSDLNAVPKGSDATGNSATVTFTAPGDDGAVGTPASYELRYQKLTNPAATCTISAANFVGTVLTLAGTPKPAGGAESFDVTLTSDNDYCIGLKVRDEVGNFSVSNIKTFTLPDVTPPGRVTTLAATGASNAVTLDWTAAGDDGFTGSATKNTVYFLATTDSCPTAIAGFTSSSSVGVHVAGGGHETVSIGSLAVNTRYCFALVVEDEKGNPSALSNVAFATTLTADPLPPNAIADLSSYVTLTSGGGGQVLGPTQQATLSWTAPADKIPGGTTGPVASYDVRVAYDTGCPITEANFAAATAVTGTVPTPGAPGAAQTMDTQIAFFDRAACFAIKSSDGTNTSAISNLSTPPGATVVEPLGTSDNTADLQFLVPGNDGFDSDSGVASVLALRYRTGSACPINSGNFDDQASTDVPLGGLTPVNAGSTQSVTVSQLMPGTTYCFAVRAKDAETAVNTSISPSQEMTTTDTTPPAQITGVALQEAPRSTSVLLGFGASGDDGTIGAASSYEIQYSAVATCDAFTYGSPSNSTLAFSVLSPPPKPPDTIEVQLSGLTAGTHYCLAVTAADDASPANRSTPSVVYGFTTAIPADSTPPGQIAFTAVAAGEVTSSAATLHWKTPANNGFDTESGNITSYDFRYVVVTAADCAALNDASFAGATPVVETVPVGSAGSDVTFTVSVLAGDVDKKWCLAARAYDAVNNPSVLSAWTFLRDNTAPAAVTTLAAGTPTSSAVPLSWTATGDDGAVGTAASYDLRYAAGTCAAFTFANATAAVGTVAPKAAGQAEAFNVTGLLSGTAYCFGLKVTDDAGNTSLISNTVAATTAPGATQQIQAIRVAIGTAPAATITLSTNNVITGAVVTYVKPAFNAQAAGTVDGPGFFIQGGATGPALFVGLDPATAVSGGLAVGDVLNLTVTGAKWLNCAGTCTANNSLYVVTTATGIARTAQGATLPAVQDLSADTRFLAPIPGTLGATGGYDLESERVRIAGTISGLFSADANGFDLVTLSTAGTSGGTSLLQLRVPDAIVQANALGTGCSVTVNGTPMMRNGATAQAVAFASADLTIGTCPSPVLTNITPTNAATNVLVQTAIVITFGQPMTGSTLTTQTTNGTCSGNIQVTADEYATCIGFSAATAQMSSLNQVALVSPQPGLAFGNNYKVRVLAGALTSKATPLAQFDSTFSTSGPNDSQVVISQLYGGGGNSGATYNYDFVELHNRSTAAVNVTGWSVQYASATGSFTQVTPLTGTIAAGGYLLVQEASQISPAPVSNLPVASDVIGAINLSGTSGKLALVSNTMPLNALCAGNGLVDLLGYGATASCLEGTTKTASLSNTTSAVRAGAGCTDTNNNLADFGVPVSTPTSPPRNSQTAVSICASSSNTLNEGGSAAEADYCAIQPNIAAYDITVTAGQPTRTIYTQIFEAGITNAAGSPGLFKAQIGYGPTSANPEWQAGWTWVDASFNTTVGNNFEYQGVLTAPATAGTYSYATRFTRDAQLPAGSQTWTYCDKNGAGSNQDQTFETTQLPSLIVQ